MPSVNDTVIENKSDGLLTDAELRDMVTACLNLYGPERLINAITGEWLVPKVVVVKRTPDVTFYGTIGKERATGTKVVLISVGAETSKAGFCRTFGQMVAVLAMNPAEGEEPSPEDIRTIKQTGAKCFWAWKRSVGDVMPLRKNAQPESMGPVAEGGPGMPGLN